MSPARRREGDASDDGMSSLSPIAIVGVTPGIYIGELSEGVSEGRPGSQSKALFSGAR